VAVAVVAIVLLIVVFTRHPAQQNCVVLSGSQQGQVNCQ
jgi:hypothetical protein